MSAVGLQSFGFGEHLVRVVDRDGGIWFVANDVCSALEISNPRDAVGRLQADEKGVVVTDTLGGQQETTIVSESGLYALIFRSRKPVAVQFRKWVTGEVLPAIRRTGIFEMPANDDEIEPPTPSEMDRAEQWRTGLQLVREARIVGGRAAARRAWTIAGLPDVFSEDEPALPSFAMTDAHRPIADWMAARCELAPGWKVPSKELYDDFEAWCEAAGRPVPNNIVSFGKLIGAFGIGTFRSNRIYRTNVRLRSG
jgi:prophage antirepressor-like protein